jgi:hypothetical protein
MKAFGWENISYYNWISYTRKYSYGWCAAQIIKYEENKYVCIFPIYPDGEEPRIICKTLDAAMKYCDKILESRGVGLLSEEYRTLL